MSLHAYPQTSDVYLMFNVVQQYNAPSALRVRRAIYTHSSRESI
jgi:hypothetical protein